MPSARTKKTMRESLGRRAFHSGQPPAPSLQSLASIFLLLITLASCGSESAAPCDECTPKTTSSYEICLQGACGSVCGDLTIDECLDTFPDMEGRILGCIDACDGCDTGLSCGPCSGPACPPQGDAPPYRCAAFNGTTMCGEGAVYVGSNG